LSLAYVVRVSGTSCDARMRRRIEAANREEEITEEKIAKREERGKGGRPVENNSLAHRMQSPTQQHLGHSRCSLTAVVLPFSCTWYMFIDVRLLSPRLRIMHDCSAHGQLVFIASNTPGSCTTSIRRSPPHPRVVSGDAHLLVSHLESVSTRNLEESSTSSTQYHVATGMSENVVCQGPRARLHAQGSNPLKEPLDTHVT
jgi:hypothetical protein